MVDFMFYAELNKRHHDWIPTPSVVGQINGLPGHRGTLVARNDQGLCLIRLGDGSLIDGHIDSWRKDKSVRQQKARAKRSLLDEALEELAS